jgi:hypothetical protein
MDNGEVSVLEEYVAHASLTYGADWCCHREDGDQSEPPDPCAEVTDDQCQEKWVASNERHDEMVAADTPLFLDQVGLQGRKQHQAAPCLRHDRPHLQHGDKESELLNDLQVEDANKYAVIDASCSVRQPFEAENEATSSPHGLVRRQLSWVVHPKGEQTPTLRDERTYLPSLIASCSFYDRSLHLWTPKARTRKYLDK